MANPKLTITWGGPPPPGIASWAVMVAAARTSSGGVPSSPASVQISSPALNVDANLPTEVVVTANSTVIPGNLTVDQVSTDSVLNVVVYGADPSGVTDSAPAIQAALNAVPANGGTVFFPAGIYLIAAPLNPTVTGTDIAGAGWGSQIRYDGSVVPAAIRMADTATRRCNIRWLRISQTSSTSHGTAIEASYFVDSAIEHVLIDGGGGGVPPVTGISFNAAGTHYNVVSDSRISAAGTNSIGIRFDATANSNVVRNCHIIPSADSSNTGVYVNATAIELDHVDIESGSGTAISLGASGHGCTITAPYLEANATNLALASGVNAPAVIGGTIEAATTADITDSGALTPMFINVRSSSGGEHAYTSALIGDYWQPGDLGLIAWNYDPSQAVNSTANQPVAGTIYLLRMPLRYTTSVTNALLYVSVAFSVTANQNFVALVDSTGVIRASSAAGSLDSKLGSTGLVTQPFSAPYKAPPGLYWLAVLANASTGSLARATSQSLSGANLGLAAANLRYAVNGTAATTLPGSFTPGSNTTTGAITFWAGLS